MRGKRVGAGRYSAAPAATPISDAGSWNWPRASTRTTKVGCLDKSTTMRCSNSYLTGARGRYEIQGFSAPWQRCRQMLQSSGLRAFAERPDWLGYLGLGLFHTEDVERNDRRLTKAWVPQLALLLREDASPRRSLRDILDNPAGVLRWEDLDGLVVLSPGGFRAEEAAQARNPCVATGNAWSVSLQRRGSEAASPRAEDWPQRPLPVRQRQEVPKSASGRIE